MRTSTKLRAKKDRETCCAKIVVTFLQPRKPPKVRKFQSRTCRLYKNHNGY